MSNTVEVFQSPAGQEIRTLIRSGEPIFCVPDVCRGLQHSNPSVALKLVDPDDRVMIDLRETDNPNLNRTSINPMMWFVTESGFYTLALASQAPGAKTFRRWITHEVLPAIRRTGRYEPAPALPQSYAEALRELAAKVEETERVKQELAVAAPKAESWDTLASGEGDYSVADAAKILSRDPVIALGQNLLFTHLANLGWIFRQPSDGKWRAKQRYMDCHWLSELPQDEVDPETGKRTVFPPQVRVTVKGIYELHRRFKGLMPVRMYEQAALMPAPTLVRPA